MIDSAITVPRRDATRSATRTGPRRETAGPRRRLDPGETARSVLLALGRALPASGAGTWRALTLASAALTSVGLFTASWERAANVTLGPYNVKLPALLLSLAVATGMPLIGRLSSLRRFRSSRVLVGTVAACVVLLVVRALFAADVRAAVPQIAAIGSGAVLPAVAVALHAGSLRNLLLMLRWFIAGGVFAAVFGVWQLTAFYLRLPQGVVYTGLGTDGVTGRVASFSYEPAYFGYFLALVIGAVLAHELLSGSRAPWYLVAGLSLVVALVNARAMLFIGPLLVALLVLRFRRYRRTWILLAVSTLAGLVLFAAMPTLVYSVERVGQSHAAGVASAPATPTASASASQGADSGGASATPEATRSAGDTTAPGTSNDASPVSPRTPALLDPHEQSSNAPRLSLISLAIHVVEKNPLFGVGLGNLRGALSAQHAGGVDLDLSRPIVANNIWLQALLDGGIPALLLELAVVAVIAIVWGRRRYSTVSPLAAAWLAVVAVGGMLTSYFFALEMWVVLGMIAAAIPLARDGLGVASSPRRVAAPAEPPAAPAPREA